MEKLIGNWFTTSLQEAKPPRDKRFTFLLLSEGKPSLGKIILILPLGSFRRKASYLPLALFVTRNSIYRPNINDVCASIAGIVVIVTNTIGTRRYCR